jgi:hypothetical protein
MTGEGIKDAAYVLIGLTFLSAFAQRRVEHAADRDIRREVHGGYVKTMVRSRGIFGLLVGESSTTRIAGAGFLTQDLPFKLEPGGGSRARVGKLELDFRDFTLRTLPLRSLRATIPAVTLDVNQALWNDRIVLRSAGEGTAVAVVDEAGLRMFVAQKYPQYKDLELRLTPGTASLSAQAALFGLPARVEATGGVQVRDGRYLDAVNTIMRLNGKEAAASLTQSIVRTLNPVLDIDKDLGLGGYIYMTRAEIGQGILTVFGRATIPRAKPFMENKP